MVERLRAVFLFLLYFLRQKERFVPFATLQERIFLHLLGLEVRLPLQKLFIIYYVNIFFNIRKLLNLFEQRLCSRRITDFTHHC